MSYLTCRIRDTGVSFSSSNNTPTTRSRTYVDSAEAFLKADCGNLAEMGLDSTSRTQTNRRASHIYFSQLSVETKTPNPKRHMGRYSSPRSSKLLNTINLTGVSLRQSGCEFAN